MNFYKTYKIDIKIIITAIAVFVILFAFACHNNQNKKNVMNPSDVDKTTSDKSFKKDSEQEELQPIENIVKQILITSTRYKQLTKGLNELVVKNGGLSFEILMERSPAQSLSDEYRYSKTYDFSLYEMYPDRRLSTARFSFSPDDKRLYEYDAVSDQLKSIEFDRNLLIKYDSVLRNQGKI